MPALLQQGCTISCPHGGTVTPVASNQRVRANGNVLLATDVFTVAGCPFTLPGPTPSPCVVVEWQMPAQKVSVGGQKPLTQSSVGVCKAATQAPQGTAIVAGVQPRAGGT